MSTSSCSFFLALLTVAVLPAGQCATAGNELASVTGKVLLDGRPLAGQKIIFHLGDDQFAGTKTKADGTFKVDRLPLGAHKITVEAMVKGRSVLPARYSSEDVSQLRFEVKKGENRFDLQLSSR
jgi:hypothetical protein